MHNGGPNFSGTGSAMTAFPYLKKPTQRVIARVATKGLLCTNLVPLIFHFDYVFNSFILHLFIVIEHAHINLNFCASDLPFSH